MRWKELHHPDLCPTVIRRNLECELMDMIQIFGDLVFSRGRSIGWTHCYETPRQFHLALHRLRQAGLVVRPSRRGETPGLRLTERGDRHMSDKALERRCERPWPGRWNVIVYDVPESERPYRDVFRSFLKRMRLGRLQRSVWVTPFDIRAEFQDLREAAAADDFAVLLEARTVLGIGPHRIVEQAWDWVGLARMQRWFLEECRGVREALAGGGLADSTLQTMAVEILAAHRAVTDLDPFLPRSLWPDGYLGPEVATAIASVRSELRRALGS